VHYIGVDLGQARDPTAIVRKVNNPIPEDFVSTPVADPPTRTYATGSIEASRTASMAPVSADWEKNRVEILARETRISPM
jgi:hypothetical protein